MKHLLTIQIFIVIILCFSTSYSAEEKINAAQVFDIMPDDLGQKTLQEHIQDPIQKISNDQLAVILQKAIREKKTSFALYLIKTYPQLVSLNTKTAFLPLQQALFHENYPVSHYIIKYFPQAVNLKDAFFDVAGSYPIQVAIEKSDDSTFKLLIDNKAEVSVKDKKNQTIVEKIIDRGVSVYEKLKFLLESPQVKNHDDVREFLVNSKDTEGLTPLCKVAKNIKRETQTASDRSIESHLVGEANKSAQLLIAHGAHCTHILYKKILTPLEQEFESEPKRAAERKKQLQQQTPLPDAVSNLVEQFLVGEPPQKTESTSATKK